MDDGRKMFWLVVEAPGFERLPQLEKKLCGGTNLQ
jgi:hypothetical protein